MYKSFFLHFLSKLSHPSKHQQEQHQILGGSKHAQQKVQKFLTSLLWTAMGEFLMEWTMLGEEKSAIHQDKYVWKVF